MLYQPNHCALLESTLVPGHAVIFDCHGKIADESSAGYADLSKEFVVFVKVKWRKVTIIYTAKYLLSFALLKKIIEFNYNGVIRHLPTRWH